MNSIEANPRSSRKRSVFQALPARQVQHHKTLYQGRFVVAALALLDAYMPLHAGRQPPASETPGPTAASPHTAVSISGAGSGSITNSSGDSVGEGLSSLRMPQVNRCQVPLEWVSGIKKG